SMDVSRRRQGRARPGYGRYGTSSPVVTAAPSLADSEGLGRGCRDVVVDGRPAALTANQSIGLLVGERPPRAFAVARPDRTRHQWKETGVELHEGVHAGGLIYGPTTAEILRQ